MCLSNWVYIKKYSNRPSKPLSVAPRNEYKTLRCYNILSLLVCCLTSRPWILHLYEDYFLERRRTFYLRRRLRPPDHEGIFIVLCMYLLCHGTSACMRRTAPSLVDFFSASNRYWGAILTWILKSNVINHNIAEKLHQVFFFILW